MRKFGRIQLESKYSIPGGPIDIDVPRPPCLPLADFKKLSGATEVAMWEQVMLPKPKSGLFTTDASGGCVPIAAAEITPERKVAWIYLSHATSERNVQDLTLASNDPKNIFVCMLMSKEGHVDLTAGRQILESEYMPGLDPQNKIPDKNALLIFSKSVGLWVSCKGKIATQGGY